MTESYWIIASYFFGSIPFGLVLCYMFGYGDIRKIGSGNIGATNVLRTGNKLLAFMTLLLDVGKGAICVYLTIYLTSDYILSLWVALAAVMGHVFPVWLKFRGGKGVATTFGTVVALAPIVGILSVFVWAVTFKLSKISSLSAVVAMTSIPLIALAYANFDNSNYFYNNLYANNSIFSFVLPLLIISCVVIIKHKQNIIRIILGTEPKVGDSPSK